ncbi:MAG: LamB/YcsF family protein [Saprospiraceae bacterium]|nr:LamB/YcsF family protein [Pyrinomonadaceae bacterium]
MLSVDLNCDMGEGFGAWKMGSDAELMKYASSVNIACGYHAGDATTIRRTVETAIEKGVAIGAHPGYPDLEGFGRRPMSLSPQEVFDIVLYQVSALKGICEATGGELHHVKPHGALYNQSAKDKILAIEIARAIKRIDGNLILYGLSGSCLISAAKELGLKSVSEVFADRAYEPDGSLTPRSEPHALIKDHEKAFSQVLQMVTTSTVTTANGDKVPVNADTVCIHGDGDHAVELAKTIRDGLVGNHIQIRPYYM